MKQEIENKEEIRELIPKVKEEETKSVSMKQNIFVILIIFLAFFILLSVYWLYKNTGNVTVEQLIFHLKVPIKGTDSSIIFDYLVWTSSITLLIVIVFAIIAYIYEIKSKKESFKKQKELSFLAKVILVLSLIVVLNVMDVFGFVKNQIMASNFIEEEYVDPSTANIVFPEEKQNLIYIYLESMENTFTSKENGGMYGKDRIPELTEIAKNNINFSNTDKMGGALDLKGTHWTIAAMVSQTSGVPLKISIGENDYGNHSTFLPGVYTLGQVLQQNGYKNYLLLGSESEFGGRGPYFKSHGDYNIWDYLSAINEKRMTEEERVWWGYSDGDLFKYAKEQLTEISQKDEPFNYTLLTVDTHFIDGYVCEDCNTDYFEEQYSNVLKCSSQKVSEFVNWIKEQPFYENTTIVISGDHLTMQASIGEQANKNNYGERTVYNAIINSKVKPVTTTNRKFFTMDMYPTTLAALGATIEGNRLGLGTNLFSNEKTLAEEFGVEYVREELEKKSTFYNKKLIYDE